MKKLALSRETVRNLDHRALPQVRGGNIDTVDGCFTIANTCVPVTIRQCVITHPCPGNTRRC